MSTEHYPGEADEAAADEASCDTPHALTRKQVEDLLIVGDVPYSNAHRLVCDHDAAQRLTIEQQAQEVEELKLREAELGELKLRLNCPILAPSCFVCGHVKPFVITHLEAEAIGVCEDCRSASQQLIAMTAERDESRLRRQETLTMSAQLADELHSLKKHLTASEQEAGRLRNNVELMARDMCSMPSDLYQEWLDSDSQVPFRQWLAKRALKGEGCQGDTPPG